MKAKVVGIYLFLLMTTVFSCSKEESIVPPENLDPKKVINPGFDYFLFTNEEWYFELEETFGVPSYMWWSYRYKILRDTFIEFDAKTYDGKILSEHGMQFGPIVVGHDSTEWFNEIVIFYDKKEKMLYRLDSLEQGGSKYVLAEFNATDSCLYRWLPSFPTTEIVDTVKIDKYRFRRFITYDGQEMVEGISLGGTCFFTPPRSEWVPYGTVILFEYKSEEFSYQWKG